MNAREGDINFADHSWNLATGGLKTLTAKRELPPGLERRTNATEKWAFYVATTVVLVFSQLKKSKDLF